MTKMSKAQAKRRLLEAQAKFKKVYMWSSISMFPVRTADMEAIEKIVARCLKRLG